MQEEATSQNAGSQWCHPISFEALPTVVREQPEGTGRSRVQNRAYLPGGMAGKSSMGSRNSWRWGEGAMCKSEALCESTVGTAHQETLAAISSYL